MLRSASAALLLLLVGLLFAGCSKRSREDVERAISSSETLRHIDQICAELPKPDDFRLYNKDFWGTSGMDAVGYQYISSAPFPEIAAFYQNSSDTRYEIVSEQFTSPEGLGRSVLKMRRDDVVLVIDHEPPSGIIGVSCIK